MTLPPSETIFALSSAAGRSGVAVVRVSGPSAGVCLDRMAAPRPRARAAAYRAITDGQRGQTLDHGLALWFPGPRSFTGEDIAEFHLHGGRAVISAVLSALASLPECRMAEPGEFARRAFENGKIDLVEAEGLADLIDAETEAQRRQALRQAGGVLSRLYEAWRDTLIGAAALAEAAIDFSDEADVGCKAMQQAREKAATLLRSIERHLDDGNRGEILREGFQAVIAGRPNVGKSSLLNCLARRDVAIVSEEAGTTRDVIEVRLDLKGLPVVVSDTAGLRETGGTIEAEGIRRALDKVDNADLVIWLADGTGTSRPFPGPLANRRSDIVVVVNKCDLMTAEEQAGLPEEAVAISAKTGDGIDALIERVARLAADRLECADELPVLTQLRHRQAVASCAEDLRAFLAGAPEESELRAEDLRRAAMALGRVTGRVDVEDILDRVFARFCIGK